MTAKYRLSRLRGTLPALQILTLVAPASAADQSVPLWHRFEGTIEARRNYVDPFRDVNVKTEFIRPDGSMVEFFGFHDGDSVWRFRMMADQTGTWTYRARFSDDSGAVEGQFNVVSSTRPAMIEVNPANPIWFGRRGGGAHLVRAFHAGDRLFASNWSEAERRRFLKTARTEGYNLLSVASHYLNRTAPGRGQGWETPDLWPLNSGEYARLESLLDECADYGFDVYPFAGFFGKSSDAPKDPREQELYVRYTLARLGVFSNIVLNVAGPEPNLDRAVYMESRDVDRLGRLIRGLDVFDHPLSLHNETGDDEYKHSSWTSFATLQGPKTLDRVQLGRGLRKNLHWAKPLFAQETLWAGNRNHPPYTHEDLRKNAFVILFSGANFCFADNAGNSSTGFSGSLDPADADLEAHRMIRLALDLFERLPFGRLRPDYTVGGDGWCLSDGGGSYLIYLDGTAAVPRAIALPEGSVYGSEWIDAREPARVVSREDVRNGDILVPPSGGDDWILRLERRPPGRR